jgi:hypothetical protein
MEKVETLVVTVPTANPENPPGAEKAWRRESAFRHWEERASQAAVG